MRLNKVLNPLEVIARRYGMFQGSRERILKAYCELEYKDFKEVVKKEYYQGGWGSPIDRDKPFPQVTGEDYFSKNITVRVTIKRKDESLVENWYEYTLDDLCTMIINLIANHDY